MTPVNCLILDKDSETYSEEKIPVKPSNTSEIQENTPQPSSKSTTPSKAESTKKVLFLLNDLQTSIIKGDHSNVVNIVKQFPTLVNTHFETGWLPLHYAAKFVVYLL